MTALLSAAGWSHENVTFKKAPQARGQAPETGELPFQHPVVGRRLYFCNVSPRPACPSPPPGDGKGEPRCFPASQLRHGVEATVRHPDVRAVKGQATGEQSDGKG